MTALRLRRCWLAIGWALLTLVVVLSLVPEPPALRAPGGDKAAHLVAYGVLMWWFLQLYPRRRWVALAGALAALGVLLEVLQGLSATRSLEFTDMLADALGVISGWRLGKTRCGQALVILERRLGLGTEPVSTGSDTD